MQDMHDKHAHSPVRLCDRWYRMAREATIAACMRPYMCTRWLQGQLIVVEFSACRTARVPGSLQHVPGPLCVGHPVL